LAVTLDHREFFRHVDCDGVFDPVLPAIFTAFRIWKADKILILNEPEWRNPLGDPVGELPSRLKEGVKVASVHRLDGVAADDDSALDRQSLANGTRLALGGRRSAFKVKGTQFPKRSVREMWISASFLCTRSTSAVDAASALAMANGVRAGTLLSRLAPRLLTGERSAPRCGIMRGEGRTPIKLCFTYC
jgi:hypothetical protein